MSKWFLSTYRKYIGMLYMMLAMLSSMIGTSLSLIIRMELSCPGMSISNDQLYNSFVTAHAVLMIFFTFMPFSIGGLEYWLMALMLGSADMAFKRMNNISFWLLPCLYYFY